jgi:hypothetical protein
MGAKFTCDRPLSIFAKKTNKCAHFKINGLFSAFQLILEFVKKKITYPIFIVSIPTK